VRWGVGVGAVLFVVVVGLARVGVGVWDGNGSSWGVCEGRRVGFGVRGK
jgi:hypothetical protein